MTVIAGSAEISWLTLKSLTKAINFAKDAILYKINRFFNNKTLKIMEIV